MSDTLTKVREKADAIQWQIKHQLEPNPDLHSILPIRREAQELLALIERLEYEAQDGVQNVAR